MQHIGLIGQKYRGCQDKEAQAMACSVLDLCWSYDGSGWCPNYDVCNYDFKTRCPVYDSCNADYS
jgi:hypothetical protein